MFRPTEALIDIAALKRNVAALKSWSSPQGFFCPMVKANAYGHDDVLVASALDQGGVSALGVSLLEEAVHLRENGVATALLAFTSWTKGAREVLSRYRITPVVGSFEDLTALELDQLQSPLGLHLKFNTGMQRMGFDKNEISELKTRLKGWPQVRVEGICTHLTHGEDAGESDGPTARQIELFKKMSEGFSGARHIHKSSSLIMLHRRGRKPEPEWGARPGIALYGIAFDDKILSPELTPVLTWRTRLIRVHDVKSGDSVSYSSRWRASRDSIIGVVPVGYGDGYPRRLGSKASMLYRGRRVPVVGTVCMDYVMLDLSEAVHEGRAQVGEEVVILGVQGGESISASELADKADTIAYEIVTGIGRRVPRVVKTA